MITKIFELFNSFFGGAFLAFFLSNILNAFELGAILMMIKKIGESTKKIDEVTKKLEKMFVDFKREGEDDKWLR